MKLEELFEIVEEQSQASIGKSWTAKLISRGPQKCAEKFGEEAIEAIIEAIREDKGALIKEAADVLFHLFVMLKSQDVHLVDVLKELESRQHQSGLAEKTSRVS